MTGAASDPRAHASPLRVVFVGLALLGVLGASLFLARPQSSAFDGATLMEQLFGGTPASWSSMEGPDGLLLPTGEKVVLDTHRNVPYIVGAPAAAAQSGAADDVRAQGPSQWHSSKNGFPLS